MGWDPRRVADPTWFLDRVDELARLAERIGDRDNLLVYGPRRLGKTSLLRRVQDDLPDRTFLFVDCPFASDEPELAQAVLDAVAKSRFARLRRVLDRARRAVQNLHLVVEAGGEGIRVRVGPGPDRERALTDVLEFVTRLAEGVGTPVVLVLDEFQTVLEADPATVGRLRAHAQRQDVVSYVLCGSRAGILLGLTRHDNPFWRQLTEFPVGPLDVSAALADVERLTGMTFTGAAAALLSDGVGRNTQRLVEVLDVLHRGGGGGGGGGAGGGGGPGGGVVDEDGVRDAVEVVVARHAASFERRFEDATPYQRRVLVALARDPPTHPTGADYVRRHRLKSASHAQKALAAHRREEVLDEDHRFLDPLFRHWLSTRAGAE